MRKRVVELHAMALGPNSVEFLAEGRSQALEGVVMCPVLEWVERDPCGLTKCLGSGEKERPQARCGLCGRDGSPTLEAVRHRHLVPRLDRVLSALPEPMLRFRKVA